jgi:hypothetical protein
MPAIPKLDIPALGLYVDSHGNTITRRSGEMPKPDGCVIKCTWLVNDKTWSVSYSDYRPLEKKQELEELVHTMKVGSNMHVEILDVYGEHCVDGPFYSKIDNIIKHYNNKPKST